MKLTKDMRAKKNESEITAFLSFTARIMSVQKQLDTPCHGDRYLRDSLLTAVDVPKIMESLKERMPRSSQKLINRVSNRFSDKPKTAGTAVVHYSSEPYGDDHVMYKLG